MLVGGATARTNKNVNANPPRIKNKPARNTSKIWHDPCAATNGANQQNHHQKDVPNQLVPCEMKKCKLQPSWTDAPTKCDRGANRQKQQATLTKYAPNADATITGSHTKQILPPCWCTGPPPCKTTANMCATTSRVTNHSQTLPLITSTTNITHPCAALKRTNGARRTRTLKCIAPHTLSRTHPHETRAKQMTPCNRPSRTTN